MRVLQNTLLGRINGAQQQEVTGECGRMLDEEIRGLYSSRNMPEIHKNSC
jgi:hypothetical protein